MVLLCLTRPASQAPPSRVHTRERRTFVHGRRGYLASLATRYPNLAVDKAAFVASWSWLSCAFLIAVSIDQTLLGTEGGRACGPWRLSGPRFRNVDIDGIMRVSVDYYFAEQWEIECAKKLISDSIGLPTRSWPTATQLSSYVWDVPVDLRYPVPR
jgi:hypothetical protein